ncbi:MAG: hypothetical protein INR68_16725 [Methylobacterium mesophilicum]|nr:hypothetical protein [Methylobacterium mesophilicum]
MEQNVAALGSAALAHGIVIKALLALVIEDADTRAKLRDRLCDATERLYERRGDVNHDGLQRVLAEIEALFDRPTPRAE